MSIKRFFINKWGFGYNSAPCCISPLFRTRLALFEITSTVGCAYLYTMAPLNAGTYEYIIDDSCDFAVSDSVATMRRISTQTNLLAMNVPLAGEFGKGFGVVANEIRALAATAHTQMKARARFVQ